MPLDPRRCYAAVQSRDARFDGRFFTAVLTTGVYCRPVCPARTPLLRNVRFYACAAAAEAAGFRPCLRCRPETAPGTPAWEGTSTTVVRALRLIESGALDAESVEELAARLGMGARHLRRLFQRHLGASPAAIARTRRLHFAKKLLDETDLPVTEVAFAAGFSSIRRFNAAFRDTLGRPPSDLRRRRTTGRATGRTTGDFRLTLAYRPPLDWEALLAFLAVRAVPGVACVRDGVYRRTIACGEDRGFLTVRHAPGRPELWLDLPLPLSRCLMPVVTRVRRLFDLGADPAAIAGCLAQDPLLAPLVRTRPGLRVPGAWDGFETAVRAILGQQVSVKGATTLAGRLAARYGEPLAADGPLRFLFPTPAALRGAPLEALGLPRQRAGALRSLAAAVDDGRLDLTHCPGLDESVAALAALPGIGPWTAHYVAMRALGEPNAFPDGDLVLRRAVGGETPLTPAQLRRRSEAWAPWRAYAALHLWAAAADPA